MRKENTIAALTQRASVLEGMIEEMNRTFLKLSDQANRADIPRVKPEFAQSLKATAERFASLAQKATTSLKDEADDGGSQTLLDQRRSGSEQLHNQSPNQILASPDHGAVMTGSPCTLTAMPTNIQCTPPASDQGQIDSPERELPMESAAMIGMGYQLLYEEPGLAPEREGPATSLPFGHGLQQDHPYQTVPRSASVMPHYHFGVNPVEDQPSLSLKRIRTLEVLIHTVSKNLRSRADCREPP